MGRHRRIDTGERPVTDFLRDYQQEDVPDDPQCCTEAELLKKVSLFDKAEKVKQ